MNPSQPLVDDIYRERILRARTMRPEEKFMEGIRLFNQSCAWMEAGIRHQMPNADKATIRRIMIERVQRLRQVEDQAWMTSPQPV
jgi:hypothetical protein